MRDMNRMLGLCLLSSFCAGGTIFSADWAAAEHHVVYREAGRFGGWPANHGIWNWGDEILVGFSAGYHKDNGPGRHAVDHDRPEEHLFARSLDGGVSWTIENPATDGVLLPQSKSLHGTPLPDIELPTVTDLNEPLDFTHPDFVMTLRMDSVDTGPSRLYVSYDRGRHWRGPYRFPHLETGGIAARTDYLVQGKQSCLAFLTAAKGDGEEGRPLCARTDDGGLSWQRLGWISPEPSGFAIMPATVQCLDGTLLSTVRRREPQRRWIETYASTDGGHEWELRSTPCDDLGAGNPASMVRLRDGRIAVAYGHRAEPFEMRGRISADQGETWSPEIVIRPAGGGPDMGYSRSVQRTDGRLVTVYYFHDEPHSERYIAATVWDPDARGE